MATTTLTGAWTPNASNNQRMRLRAVIDVPAPGAGATSVTVTGTVWVDAGYGFSDSNNSFAHSGSLLGSGSMSRSINIATNGSQAIWTFSQVVALTSAAQGKTVAFSLTGIEYVPGTAVVSGTVSVPAAVPAASLLPPNAATALTVSRRSDTHHVIGYTGTVATNRPIRGVRIVRETMTAGNGTTIGDVEWSFVSGSRTGGINDKATKAGSRYRWAVQLYNEAGSSGWVYTGWHKTTPTVAPRALQLSRSGSQVQGVWDVTLGSTAAWDGQQISYQYTDASTAWTAWTNLAVDARSHTWTPAQQRVRFRVRGYTTEGATLYGPPAVSGWVNALGKPNPPTPTGPSEAQLVGTRAMTWQHNPIDGTSQLQYEHRWRVDGGAFTTSGAVTSSAQQRSVSLPAGVIGWQVRTRGSHPSWSDWSPEVTFVVAERPTVTVVSPTPGGVVDTNRLVVTIAYGESSGAPMTGWRRQLMLGNAVVEDVSGAGAVDEIRYATLLPDNAQITALVSVTSGHGIESVTAEAVFFTSFSFPQRPMITDAAWVEDQGHVRLGVGLAEDLQLLPDPGGLDAALLHERADSSSSNVEAQIYNKALAAYLSAGSAPTAVFRWGAPGPVEVFPGVTYRFTAHVDSAAYIWRRWRMDQLLDDGTEVTVLGPEDGQSVWWAGFIAPWEWTPDAHGWVVPAVEATSLAGGGWMLLSQVTLSVDADGTTPAHIRLEQSLDEGTTWQELADELPIHGGGHLDATAPLNTTPWYRPVSVSPLGVERPGIPVRVHTPGQVVWLNTADSAVRITFDMEFEHTIGHQVVFEEYLTDDGERHPTPHYGPGRSETVRVGGRFVDDINEHQLGQLLGQTVWWRDPTGRSWPASVEAGGVVTSRNNPRVAGVQLTARRVHDG